MSVLLLPFKAIMSIPLLFRSHELAPQVQLPVPMNPFTRDGFNVQLDVQHFMPNEITVKTFQNSVIIEGNHEEKEDDHGFITRSFIRRYELPENYDLEKLQSSLSSDGILMVKAPRKEGIEQEQKQERIIQIEETGPVREAIKESLINKDSSKEGVENKENEMKGCKSPDENLEEQNCIKKDL